MKAADMFVRSSGDMTADRRMEMARQLASRGDDEGAADLARQALEIAPRWTACWFYLGETLMRLDRGVEAAQAFAACLDHDPADAMGASLKLAILGGAARPDRMPDDYVRSLFDQYAPRFDRALVEGLGYRAPQLMRDAVERFRPGVAGAETIIDLGCGTGLAGEAFGPRAAAMDGVDLSQGMIAEAARKNIYRSLAVADLRAWLAECGARYDIALAADVFVYLGRLDDVFIDVQRILKPGGLFCFTVQKTNAPDFVLGADHRYAYSADYIRAYAGQAGFLEQKMSDAVLRRDEGRDVDGLVCLFTR